MPKLYIDLFAEKYLGREQELNEDSIFCIAAGNSSKMSAEILAVLGVADGMGGPDAGVVASTIATEYLANLFMKGGYDALARQQGLPCIDHNALINGVFQSLNGKILDRAGTLQGRGPIGTTFTFGLITYSAQDDKTYLHVGNVGNSRCYIVRGDQIFHATEDDTHAWQLYKKGEITYAEMLIHPLRHASTVLGVNEAVAPQVHSIEVLQNDIVLFCTDGLHDTMDDAEIEYIVNSSANTRDAVKALAASAKAAGAADDIAIVLAYCSAKPMAANAGFAAGVPAGGMTMRRKAVIGVLSAAALLVLAALIAYFFIPRGPQEAAAPAPVAARPVQEREALMTAATADSVQASAAGDVKSEAVPKTVVTVQTTGGRSTAPAPAGRVQTKKETPPPKMSVEWIAQTKRFRIHVNDPAVIPVTLSCGHVSFDVVAVTSIPNLYKTTTPAEAEMLPEKGMVTIKLKGPGTRAVSVGFTTID